MDRATITSLFVRICRDSKFQMSAVDAAIFTANVLNIAPLEVWIAIGSMDTMMQIANGSHASVENNRG